MNAKTIGAGAIQVPSSQRPEVAWLLPAGHGPGGLWQTIGTWMKRAQARRELAALTEEQRKDMGLTEQQIVLETLKPFWRA